MTKLKSERHHWWPEGVSEFWKNADGCVHRLTPDGKFQHAPPKNFGVIGNGHHVKLGPDPKEDTAWDHSFEAEFNRADSHFPEVIKWLENLPQEGRPNSPLEARFKPVDVSEEKLSLLVEGMVSLAVRSPMNRQAAVGVAETLRGAIPQRERNALIGLNMRNRQRRTVESIGTRAKFAVIYSPDREFIFGDGFFHNITSPAGPPPNPQILVPLTPRISVLFARPIQFTTEPKVMTFVADAAEADALNAVIQIYAKNEIFYRSEKPEIISDFELGEHRAYDRPGNPIDTLIHSIPGVPPRDTGLDMLFAGLRSGRVPPHSRLG